MAYNQVMPQPISKPSRPLPSKQTRNKSETRRNWSKVEDYLTNIEKVRGFNAAWELRGQLERGEVSLKDLTGVR